MRAGLDLADLDPLLQETEGGCGLGKERGLRGIEEVPPVLDQGPVAIEEDGTPRTRPTSINRYPAGAAAWGTSYTSS